MEENEPLPEHLRCNRKMGPNGGAIGKSWTTRSSISRDAIDSTREKYLSHSNCKGSTGRNQLPMLIHCLRMSKLGQERGKIVENGCEEEEERLKRGDLLLELARIVLRREVENRKKKKKKKKKKIKKVVVDEIGSDNDNDIDSSNSEGELTRDLPNGLMAISPLNILAMWMLLSKNIEPMPIGTLQVVPFKKDMLRLRRGKRKKCHLCRRSGLKTLIRCSNSRKQFYCMDCIKDQYSDRQEEVKVACPVCLGTCGCKACSAIQCRDIECKDFSKDKILKQLNQDQSIELEIEAKIKGQKPPDVQIQQASVGCNKKCYCNNCKSAIVDFHRSCPSCSYNLCLSCCQDFFQGSLLGSVATHLCKCPDRSTCVSGKQLSGTKSACISKWNCGNKILDSSMLLPSWKVPDGNGIPCPPTEVGGCGDSILDLSCVFPSSWTKELEMSAEEIVRCYELPEAVDIFSRCSLCLGMDCEVNGIMQLQEAAKRENSNDNFLYYPTIVVLL
ncbi:hypothetical protein MANES_07G075137v8 [Manihot esculenta]|uniref:Uncharacterized protein n=1 Tax=Manihot esculenta TaxID=3983 RepID=A0ACB7HFX2_MANES|nr:hypothetical protein MANES_07G075137v8 [Manihot esculenta]